MNPTHCLSRSRGTAMDPDRLLNSSSSLSKSSFELKWITIRPLDFLPVLISTRAPSDIRSWSSSKLRCALFPEGFFSPDPLLSPEIADALSACDIVWVTIFSTSLTDNPSSMIFCANTHCWFSLSSPNRARPWPADIDPLRSCTWISWGSSSNRMILDTVERLIPSAVASSSWLSSNVARHSEKARAFSRALRSFLWRLWTSH